MTSPSSPQHNTISHIAPHHHPQHHPQQSMAPTLSESMTSAQDTCRVEPEGPPLLRPPPDRMCCSCFFSRTVLSCDAP